MEPLLIERALPKLACLGIKWLDENFSFVFEGGVPKLIVPSILRENATLLSEGDLNALANWTNVVLANYQETLSADKANKLCHCVIRLCEDITALVEDLRLEVQSHLNMQEAKATQEKPVIRNGVKSWQQLVLSILQWFQSDLTLETSLLLVLLLPRKQEW